MSTLTGAKYLWKLPIVDQAVILHIASHYMFLLSIAQTLYTRGHITPEQINAYLFSSLERDVAHPSLMKDAQKAVDRIMYAINSKKKYLFLGIMMLMASLPPLL